jgi:dienelactone hydrolase
MTLRLIPYEADGVSLSGWLADGSRGASAPGILVAHEAPGADEYIKTRTQALADLGYVAFALDLYGSGGGFPLERLGTPDAVVQI